MFKISNCTTFIPKRRTREDVDTYRIQVFGASEDSITVVTDSDYGKRYKFKQPCRIYANSNATIIDANEFWICNQGTPDEYIVLINSVTEALVAQCILANTVDKMIRITANEEGDTNYYQIDLLPMEPTVNPNATEDDNSLYNKETYPIIKMEYDHESNTASIKAKLGFRSPDFVTIESYTSNKYPFASINTALSLVDSKEFNSLEDISYNSFIVQEYDGKILTVRALEDYFVKVTDENNKLYNVSYVTLLKGITENAYYVIPTNKDGFCIIADTMVVDPKGTLTEEIIEPFKSNILELIKEGLDEIITETIEINPDDIDNELLRTKSTLMEHIKNKARVILDDYEKEGCSYDNIYFIHKDESDGSTYIINLNEDFIKDLDDVIETLKRFMTE